VAKDKTKRSEKEIIKEESNERQEGERKA